MDALRDLLEQLKAVDDERSFAPRDSAEYRDASARVDALVDTIWQVAVSGRSGGPRSRSLVGRARRRFGARRSAARAARRP